MKILRQCAGVILLVVMILLATVVSRRHGDNLIEQRTWKDTVMSFLQDDLRALEQEKIFLEKDEVALKREHIEHQRANIERNADVKRYSTIALVASVCAALLLSSWLWGLARVKAASVHMAKIGTSEIPVHERDIRRGRLAEQLTMLANAEQLRQTNAGQEHAFQIYQELAATQTAQLRALRGVLPVHAAALPAATPEPVPAALPATVPTFRELLNSGEIAQGKQMILGYHNGVPRRGSFLDIYSSAVAGESGSGKTGTLLYLTGSGIVADHVQFLIIDPHYPHPKSLAFKLRPLWDAGLIQVSTALHEAVDMLQSVENTIDCRLKQTDTTTTPVVLVIDELSFLNKTSIKTELAHTMERISTEGRKCAVYMLASSQTWLVARTGDSSAVRDTLTSSFVHRIKPKQANLLLQDKDEADKVKRLIKKAGDALLCPVNDDSIVVKIPYTTVDDMRLVANMGQVNRVVNVDHVVKPVDRPVDPENRPIDLLVKKLENKEITLTDLCQRLGVDKGYVSKVLHGQKPMSAKLEQKIKDFLAPENVIQGPWNL